MVSPFCSVLILLVMLVDSDPKIAGFVDLIVVYSIPNIPAAPADLNNTMW